MKENEKILSITDPVYKPKAGYNIMDRFLLRLINDPRDLPFMHFIIEATVVVLPLVFGLYFYSIHWAVAMLYVPFVVFVYMDRFILILHNISHRPLFRKKYRILNYYIVWILGPLFGESPETYFAHHIGMHHVEENLEDDLSSTMKYQRDSFTAWLSYFLRFFFGVFFSLIHYMSKKGRRKLLLRLIAGEIGYFIFVAAMFMMNPLATVVVFIIPFILCRLAMMAGNWGQHAFIDSSRPSDPFASSITVINCRYNRRSFNDGYHIGHHENPRCHWTDLPVDFQKNSKLYGSKGAIVFEGIDFTMVWIYLMFKRYDVLARHFVDLGTPARSVDDVITLLKSRTMAIPAIAK